MGTGTGLQGFCLCMSTHGERAGLPRAAQVLEWTQTMLAAGEAFCGSESATLRDALQRQSGRFFAAYHSANLQA